MQNFLSKNLNYGLTVPQRFKFHIKRIEIILRIMAVDMFGKITSETDHQFLNRELTNHHYSHSFSDSKSP